MRPALHALLLLLAALGVRLAASEAAFRADRRVLLPDEKRYLEASRGALLAEWRRPEGFGIPPGYPAFLRVAHPPRLWGALLGALSCLALVPLGRRVCGIGWPCAWAAALSPLCAASSAWLLSEALYVPLLVLAGWGISRGSPGGALAAGGILVAAHLTRPLALPYAALLLAWLALAGRGRCAWALALGGWAAFLALAAGAGAAPASRMLVPVDRVLHTWSQAWESQSSRPYLSGRGDEGSGESGPLLALRRAGALWRPMPRTGQLRGRAGWIVAGAWALTVPAALLGAWLAFRDWRRTGWLPLLLLYTTAVHMAFLTSLRYRMPLEPFLVVLAAWGYARIRTRTSPA